MPHAILATELELFAMRAGRRLKAAHAILHAGYTVLPVAAGADKFFHFLVNWDMYLSPRVAELLPVSGHTFMLFVGVVEIAAGLLTATAPRIGGLVVGLWLLGIVGNLLLIPGFLDIALRDFGLALGAFALWKLSGAVIALPEGGGESSGVHQASWSEQRESA